MKIKILIMILLSLILVLGCKSSDEEFIRIAVLGPMENEAGIGIKNGAQLAADQINSQNGVTITQNGQTKKYKIELVFVDDKLTDVGYASQQLLEAIEKKGCRFIVGGYVSKVMMPLMDIMAAKKVIWYGTGGASTSIIKRIAANYERYKYYFRTGSLDTSLQGKTVSEIAIKKLLPRGLKKAAMISLDHAYARIVIEDAKKYMQAAGIEIVAEKYVSAREKDFSAFLKTAAAKASYIVCAFLTNETMPFVEQAAAMGLTKKMLIFGSIGPANVDQFYQQTQGKAAYIMSLQGQGGPIDRVGNGNSERYEREYKKRYHIEPYWTSHPAFHSVWLVKTVIEKTGGQNPDKIIQLMESDNFEFEGTYRLKWYKHNHDVYSGRHNGKMYGLIAWFQFFPDGKRYCVYPDEYQQRKMFIPGIR